MRLYYSLVSETSQRSIPEESSQRKCNVSIHSDYNYALNPHLRIIMYALCAAANDNNM